MILKRTKKESKDRILSIAMDRDSPISGHKAAMFWTPRGSDCTLIGEPPGASSGRSLVLMFVLPAISSHKGGPLIGVTVIDVHPKERRTPHVLHQLFESPGAM